MFLIENDDLGLRQYTHEDDRDMYACWQDMDTQKGYNGIFDQSFDEFRNFDINRFRFWVTVVDKNSGESVGTLRLGLDESCPDLAIWIYPHCRNRGYGTKSFRLALEYIFDHYEYSEISAGCFCDNVYSMRMLKSIGFVRYPAGDEKEPHFLTGKETVQLEFRIKKDMVSEAVG